MSSLQITLAQSVTVLCDLKSLHGTMVWCAHTKLNAIPCDIVNWVRAHKSMICWNWQSKIVFQLIKIHWDLRMIRYSLWCIKWHTFITRICSLYQTRIRLTITVSLSICCGLIITWSGPAANGQLRVCKETMWDKDHCLIKEGNMISWFTVSVNVPFIVQWRGECCFL